MIQYLLNSVCILLSYLNILVEKILYTCNWEGASFHTWIFQNIVVPIFFISGLANLIHAGLQYLFVQYFMFGVE